jgi:2-iminobutanoate/2-iminopropanoate deaminase
MFIVLRKWSLFALSAFIFLEGCVLFRIKREVIYTREAPAAIGPYSQAIKAGNTLFLAGQIALDPATGQLVEGGIEAQTHQVIRNIQSILKAAGFSPEDVVQSQVFLMNLDDYATFNSIYAGYFKTDPPARAVVQVARLPRNALLEVMVTAVKTQK